MTSFSRPGTPWGALIVVLLVGCAATPAELYETRDTWQGASYGEVVARWGAPSRSAKLTDGRDSYSWDSESAGTRASGGGGIGTGVMFRSPEGESVRCERTLIFKDGRVAEQNWQGPAEYCKDFRRSN